MHLQRFFCCVRAQPKITMTALGSKRAFVAISSSSKPPNVSCADKSGRSILSTQCLLWALCRPYPHPVQGSRVERGVIVYGCRYRLREPRLPDQGGRQAMFHPTHRTKTGLSQTSIGISPNKPLVQMRTFGTRENGLARCRSGASFSKAFGWVLVGVAYAFVLSSAARAQSRDHCDMPPAHAEAFVEHDLTVQTPDGRIQGTLAVPEAREPRALVLMLHGFRGARNENGGMFRRTAHTFAGYGLASLRIDFIGSGKSGGAWADTRFSTQARDALRAAAVSRDMFNDTLPITVLGYSQGGLVALRAAATQEAFDRVAVWAPPLDPMATYGIIFGQETILDAARTHRYDGTNDVVEGQTLRTGFFAELAEADPIADAAQSTSPMLIVTAERDPLVKNGVQLAKDVASGRVAETDLLHVNSGHDFGALHEPQMLAHVVACTAKFLLGGQGLMSSDRPEHTSE